MRGKNISVRSVVAVLLCVIGVALGIIYTVFFADTLSNLGSDTVGGAIGTAFGLVFMIICAAAALAVIVFDILVCVSLRAASGEKRLSNILCGIDLLLSLYIIISAIVTIAFI